MNEYEIRDLYFEKKYMLHEIRDDEVPAADLTYQQLTNVEL